MVPFKISDESVKQMRSILSRSPEARPEHAIRIYISGLTGSGPEWSLSLDNYSPQTDECCEFDGLRVIVERELLEAIGGLDVEYEIFEEEEGGFVITALDPDVQALYGGCGCGCGCGGCGSCEEGCDGECETCGHHCEHEH